MKIFVTGGAGFIGANFLLRMVPRCREHTFVNVDALTYAGNPLSLNDIADAPNYAFEHVDITQSEALRALFEKWSPDSVIHFAAESHVDRSLLGPAAFVQTNIIGTFNLLECCRQFWTSKGDGTGGPPPHALTAGTDSSGSTGTEPRAPIYHRFHHVSTDEVYGSLGDEGSFSETTPYDPSSPYSASKAASDHLVRAYNRSYGLNTTLTNCSNNYGPRQFPEKLIPLMILNAVAGEPLPVYGAGTNVRDWLYVDDHCDAIWEVFTRSDSGATYNIGGDCEMRNIDVVEMICDLVGEERGVTSRQQGADTSTPAPSTDLRALITFVKDRPGHDFRYAMDIRKIQNDLDWKPKETFASGLRKTVRWYLDNEAWIKAVRSGEYLNWLDQNYAKR